MNKAISIYEDLVDGFLYTAKDWLHLDLADKTIQEGKEISAAASFLFDNLFLKENAGAAISKAAREDLGNDFRPERLGSLATKMRLAMTGTDFMEGTSPLREYLKWVSEYEPAVRHASLDDAGKLALVIAEEFTNLLLRENQDEKAPMHVAEIVFLTTADKCGIFFLDFLGKETFRSFRSYPFFESIQTEMERIRTEIYE